MIIVNIIFSQFSVQCAIFLEDFDGFEQGVVRLCFAKRDETLQAALERLQRL